jgi:hypothetical protein
MTEGTIEKISLLLQGKIPLPFDMENITDETDRNLSILLNQLIGYLQEINEFIIPLSQGQLDEINLPHPRNFLGSPFKDLHARLRHLTWQAKQVASGDYSQRVDFMGDFSEAFNFMIESLDNKEKALKSKIAQLEEALSHIEKLEGILPICANCKKIRNNGSDPKNQNNWIEIESYISKRTEAKFSHGICPECMEKLYPEICSDYLSDPD